MLGRYPQPDDVVPLLREKLGCVAAAILRPLADVAQLVERLLAMQKVEGSSPFIRFNEAATKAGFFVPSLAPRGG